MENPVEKEAHFPLPVRQYSVFILLFSVVSLGALLVSLTLTLRSAWGALTWREGLYCLTTFIQIALYAALMLTGSKIPIRFERMLPYYFAGSLFFWLMGYILVPASFWVVFAYIGQMFGLLPLKAALLISILLTLFITFTNQGLRENLNNSYGIWIWVSQVISVLFFMAFINLLIHSNRERGRLINELKHAQKQLEEARQKDAELAALRERERLARDLHDILGHNLAAVSVQLEAIQRLYRVDPVEASQRIDELKKLTRASMEDLRRSLAGLRTPGLSERPLDIAAESLCVEFAQRTGLEVTCRVSPKIAKLSPVLAEALWRVLQEALTNIEKHAQARKVTVLLEMEGDRVSLEVCDDGRGIVDSEAASANRYGLRGMRERIEGLGGRLEISNQPGACIRATLSVIGKEIHQ